MSRYPVDYFDALYLLLFLRVVHRIVLVSSLLFSLYIPVVLSRVLHPLLGGGDIRNR